MTGRSPNLDALGQFIRTQRKLAELSQRELAKLTNLSNPYVSQLERGLHEPSLRVLRAIASALNMRAEILLTQAGLLGDDAAETATTEEAIRLDPELSDAQKQALLGVYRSFVEVSDIAAAEDTS